jgi:2-polyprenyl-3-methyl-5-hydroxy-6-metoxy-1,4-benzoquinol methylase
LDREYPESLIVHGIKDKTSRYTAVIGEIEPFAMKGRSLLDVGCNDSVYTIPYALMDGKAHGIDVSKSLTDGATQKSEALQLSKVTFEVADIEDFVCSEKYDVVLMSEVIEHLINPDKALLNIEKCLRNVGVFILTAPTPLFEIEQLFTRPIVNFSY